MTVEEDERVLEEARQAGYGEGFFIIGRERAKRDGVQAVASVEVLSDGKLDFRANVFKEGGGYPDIDRIIEMHEAALQHYRQMREHERQLQTPWTWPI